MTQALLKFQSLQEMADCIKRISPDAFIMDTKALTLLSVFDDRQFALATGEYGAYLVRRLDKDE